VAHQPHEHHARHPLRLLIIRRPAADCRLLRPQSAAANGVCSGRHTPAQAALPIAGNDPGAKKHAAELLSLLGYDSVDMGPLTESWRSQVGTPVFCAPYAMTKDDQYRNQPAAPASAAEVRAALASARR